MSKRNSRGSDGGSLLRWPNGSSAAVISNLLDLLAAPLGQVSVRRHPLFNRGFVYFPSD